MVQFVAVALIPKPKGGNKPIGVHPAVERLWAKSRSELAVQWQRGQKRDYFACSEGTGAEDVVCHWNVRRVAVCVLEFRTCL